MPITIYRGFRLSYCCMASLMPPNNMAGDRIVNTTAVFMDPIPLVDARPWPLPQCASRDGA